MQNPGTVTWRSEGTRMDLAPSVEPVDESTVIVRFGDESDASASDRVSAFVEDLRRYPLAGQMEVVAAYASAAIIFDAHVRLEQPFETAARERCRQIAVAGAREPRVIDVPVCYDPALSPDLETVATSAHLSIDEVVRIHSERTYRVHLVGYASGFPYIGALDERLALPRRINPVAQPSPGSVAIGGNQTGIYLRESSCDWWIIGRTTSLELCAGDVVRFIPVARRDIPLIIV